LRRLHHLFFFVFLADVAEKGGAGMSGSNNPEAWFNAPEPSHVGGAGSIQYDEELDNKGKIGTGGTGGARDVEGLFEPNKLYYQVAGQVFNTAKNQAGGFLNLYANIDLIRPYFDVDLKMVVHRLRLSLVPRTTPEILNTGTPDLYGPSMLVFSLVALLLLGMKLSDTKVEEGTLMGTALAVCLSYWVVASLVFRFTAYLCSMELAFLDSLCVTGYAMFGYCLTLIVRCFLPSLSTPAVILFGSLSAGTLAGMFFGQIRSRNRSHALVAATTVFAIHFLFLLYIRYEYASVYEAAAAATRTLEHHPPHDTPVTDPVGNPIPDS
jgi:hypothetical protein